MKMFKRFMAVGLSAMMMFAVPVYADEYYPEETDAPVATAPIKPVIMISDPLSVEIDAGTAKTVDVSFKNVTSDTASKVITRITTPDGSGLVASFEGNDDVISSIGNKQVKKTKLKITADSTAKEGIYVLTFKHTYLNTLYAELSSESTIQVKVINKSSSTILNLNDIASSKGKVSPGDEFVLSAKLKNEGSEDIKKVSVTIDGLKSDEIFIKNNINVINFNSILHGATEDINITLNTNSKIKAGSYPLTLKVDYNDGSETGQSKTYTYYVNVSEGGSSQNKSQVVITNISGPTATMGVSDEFTMGITVKNTSNYVANNIKIAAKPEGEGAVVPKSTSVITLDSLGAGETKEYSFIFVATASSKSQNYVIGFTVDYETGKETAEGKDEVLTYTQYQGVNISNPEADKKEQDEKEPKISVPKIIIKEYLADPLIVKAGQEFDLSMTFLNTSSDKPIKNIKAYLTVDEGTEKKGNVFSPVNSSNTFYIDKIQPKGLATNKIRLYAIPDASPKTYTINVNFEYEDMENNEYKSTEIVGINVKQVTKLQTSEISIDQFAQMYQPIYINFELYNTGKVTLSNLMITIEGNFEASQSSVYYGSFSASSTEYYDNTLTPTEEGKQEGAIVISYEDDSGEKVEERMPFTVEVSPAPVFDESEMMGEMEGMVLDPKTGMMVPEKQGLSMPVMIGIGAVAVAAVIGIVVAVVLKKKKGSIDLDE